MKTWKKVVRILFLVVVIVPTVTAIAVQIPAVQTALVGKVTRTLSQKIDGSVHVGKVYFSFPNNVILKDVDVIQGADDTLAHVGKVLASVSTPSLLFSNQARIRRVSVEDATVSIRKRDDGTTNLQALLAPLKKDKQEDQEESGTKLNLPWERIRLDHLTLKDINVAADSLDVRDLNLSVRDIRYDGSLSARIERLTGEERVRDVRIDQLDGSVALDSTGLRVRDFNFNDRNSDLHADVDLGFSVFSDFSDFLNKVHLDANVQNTFFDLKSLQPLLGKDIPALALWLDGKVSGTVSDLRSDRIKVQTESKETAADLRFRVRGLPDFDRLYLNAEVLQGVTRTSDLGNVLSALSPNIKKSDIARYAPGETISLTARAEGPLENLKVSGRADTKASGSAVIDGTVHKKGRTWGIDGTVEGETLALDRLLGISSLGTFTGRTNVALSSSKNNLSAEIDPLHIDRFTFNGYEYHDLHATGSLHDGRLTARLDSGDPNLKLALQANAELGGKHENSHYVIDLDLDNANLGALHFDKRDSTSVSLALDADVVQTPEGAFLGDATIRNMKASIGERIFPIGDLTASSWQDDDRYGMLLNASFAKAEYDGNIFVTDFFRNAYHLVMEDNLEHLFGGTHSRAEDEEHPEHFGSFRLRTLDLQPFLDFFKPGLFVSQQSSISLDLIDNEVQGGVSSELLALDNHFLRNLQGRFYTQGEQMRGDFDADRLQIGTLTAENVTVDAWADSSVVDLKVGFDNQERSDNRAALHAQVSFPDSGPDGYKVRADILPSEIVVAGQSWELTPATVLYRDKHIRINDFAIRNGNQSLVANGIAGDQKSDTLRVRLNDFDISLANAFLNRDLDLQGNLTGRAEGFALLGEGKGILLDLKGRDMAAAGCRLGELQLGSLWDDPGKQFRFLLDNTLDGANPLHATASYRPSDKHIGLDARLDNLTLGILEPLLSGLASDISGSASGHIKASGPLQKISVESEGTRFNQLTFKLDYTQVTYTADGPFTVGNTGITFDNIDILDRFDHHAKLTGGVPYDHFKNLTLNARIDLHGIHVLNTSSHDNDSFYGQAFANGQVRLSGPLDKVRLSLNLTTQPNTSVHIPLGNSAKQKAQFLTFINNESDRIGLIDSMVLAKQVNRAKKNKSGNDLSVNLRLNATPDGEIQLEIDKNSGDILKARGNGQIGITAGNQRDFTIQGDYRVESGSYHFGMLGFTSRDFSINPGGTIGFNGDVMDSDLDMTATYRTKASISPLIADSTAVGSRRTVDCGIHIAGKLANPEITFQIDIPDLDPTIKSMVDNALNTEDKRMRQALALIVSGGFVPDEQSGIVNSSTMLYSNASELMASQLNNIFRQLDIPIDLGFNYQPTEDGRNIFDVAVSTQLFNNRVSINGNIGNRQYYSSSASDIVGDVDVEIKLNKSGQLRLTLFSHSADLYSNALDLSQRNGAGIVYQEDFNSFRELWRKLLHIQNKDERETSFDPNAPRRTRSE